MVTQSRVLFRLVGRAVISGLILYLVLTLNVLSSRAAYQEPDRRLPEIAIEIKLPDKSLPRRRLPGGDMTLIRRQSLNIIDPVAAGGFTAIDLSSIAEGDSMTVRLAIIYNDVSNQEWWKDKKEKVAGTWVIQRGESVRPDLTAFGIESFEMSVTDAKAIVFKPGEGPRIVNKTTVLEVVSLKRQLDHCSISLRNTSSKNIVAYSISIGGSGVSSHGRGLGYPAVAAGATTSEQYLRCSEKDDRDIVISNVIFDDGSFEGDSKVAQQYLANADGLRIQAPHVLRRVEQVLAIPDSDLRAAFDKLEADLWVIPEAIDKQSALDYLAKKLPSLDSKTVNELYEDLKGGLYDARNIALSEIGDTRRYVQELEERGQFASAVESIRRTLERLRESLSKITASRRVEPGLK